MSLQTTGKDIGLPRTQYRRPQQNEPLWIVADFGNSDVKVMIHGHYGEELVFPHAVRKASASDYKTLAEAYKHRAASFEGTAIFHADGEGVVVGAHAAQVGDGKRLLGAEKYRRDHLGHLLRAALLQLYPTGHPDVHLVILHPVKTSVENLKAMGKAVRGKHDVNVADGRKVHYNITEVIPLDESTAAFQTFVLTQKGLEYANPRMQIIPGMEFMILDIGGWISAMSPGFITNRKRIEINVDASTPLDIGIQHVFEVLEGELKATFPELQRITRLSQKMLSDAIMHDSITIRGVVYECAQPVANAMQTLIMPLKERYTGRYRDGVDFSGVVVTGGGGGAAFDYVRERLLGTDYAYSAESDLAQMRFGGVRGASKGLMAHLATRS